MVKKRESKRQYWTPSARDGRLHYVKGKWERGGDPYKDFHKIARHYRRIGWKRYFSEDKGWSVHGKYPVYSRRTEIQQSQKLARPQVTVPRFQPPRVVDTSRPMGEPQGTFVDRYASLRYSKEDLPYQYRNKDWNIYTPQEWTGTTPGRDQELKELQRQDRLMWESIHSRLYWKSFLWGQRLPGNMGDVRFAGSIREPRTTKFKWWDIINKGKVPDPPIVNMDPPIPPAGGPEDFNREPCYEYVYVPSIRTWKKVPCGGQVYSNPPFRAKTRKANTQRQYRTPFAGRKYYRNTQSHYRFRQPYYYKRRRW